MLAAHVDLIVAGPLVDQPRVPPPTACPSDILADAVLTTRVIQVLPCLIALENCSPSRVSSLAEVFRNNPLIYWRSSLIT